MRISFLVGALAFGALLSGAAFAYDAATPTPDATPAMDAAAKAAKSDECYKRADAKNLHFKDRKDFHRECMKAP
jgi:hypothetical protein